MWQRTGQGAGHSLVRKVSTGGTLGLAPCSKQPESFETAVGRMEAKTGFLKGLARALGENGRNCQTHVQHQRMVDSRSWGQGMAERQH